MKFSAAVLIAAAAGASAWKSNVTYTTEVVTAYTTYCPGPTEITHGGTTYTVTEVSFLLSVPQDRGEGGTRAVERTADT
jgi:hypothetical protein